MDPAGRQRVLELSRLCNNRGVSPAADRAGGFNVWQNTFPAEQLPEGGALVEVAGVRFRFPTGADGQTDNVVCDGQLVAVPPGDYDWLYVLAAGERRSEDPVYLHYEGGAVDPEWLRVSDFWPGPSRFGEPPAFRTRGMHYPSHVQANLEPTIWLQRVPVTRLARLAAVRLPENRAMHLFAATLVPGALPRPRPEGLAIRPAPQELAAR
jgi:hypothetical protein